jgi:hypothetical protein
MSVAPQFAMEVLQNDLPWSSDATYSVLEIDQLPHHLNHRAPKFQGNWSRAWRR